MDSINRLNSLQSRDERRREFALEMNFRNILKGMRVPPHMRSDFTPKSNKS